MWDDIGNWLTDHGLKILLIIVLSYAGYRAVKAVVRPAITGYVKSRGKRRHSKSWFDKRAGTLSSIVTAAAAILVSIIALSMILSELGIDIGPLLASAGIAGVALGFGAQSLIKDLLSGIFIMLEDQYNVGDVVKIAGVCGAVEEITFRRTTLRDLDGIVHNIPNGEIAVASNYTRDYARVNLDVPVAYGEDLDKVMAVIDKVGNAIAQDEHFKTLIKTPPKALRVNNFGDSGIDIKILGDVRPMHRWEVTGELRKRLKKAFDQEGIEIPWPHVKLYFGKGEADNLPKS